MSTARIGSLFSGYGGLDQGVRAVLGGTVAWHSEIDAGACRILAHHHPDVPNLGDITTVDWAEVEPVDVLTGGYPCQPFSPAGFRRGTDDSRHLWPNVLEAIRSLRPRYAVMENVAGHRSLGFGRVLGDLASIRYDATWASLRASDVEAPHDRERLIFVAYPEGAGPGEPLRAAGLPLQPGRGDRLANPRVDAARAVWLDYARAVVRWGDVVGRPAPRPNIGSHLSPEFCEWLMGLPAGYVTNPVIWAGMTAPAAEEAQLRALGNGVVPQQAEAALRLMLSRVEAVA